MGRAKRCVVFATLCLVAACSAYSRTDSNSRPNGGVSYETKPCPQPNVPGVPELDFPSEVRCGYLTVPENRAQPDGPQIRIFVMRAPAPPGGQRCQTAFSVLL